MIILIASNLREIVWLYSLILELRPVYYFYALQFNFCWLVRVSENCPNSGKLLQIFINAFLLAGRG